MKTAILLSVLAVLCMFAVAASAATSTQQAYWHNSDYYAIQLDGAGNGFIGVEMNLQSISSINSNTLTLDIPYVGVTIYQLVTQNSTYYYRCYSPYCNYNTNPAFVNYSAIQQGNSTILTVHLNHPLNASNPTTLYLFYSVTGLAKKNLQGYQFSFKTITDPNALIKGAYASVEVPQNMHLKGEPTFNISYNAASALTPLSSAAAFGAAIPSIFYSSYQYQASNLLPGEYFTITGLYGNSLVLLYLPEIVLAVLVLAVVVLLFKFMLVSKIKKLFSKPSGRFSFSRALLVGAASGLLFQAAYFGMQLIYSLISGGYYFYSSPVSLLFALLSLILEGLALFALPYLSYTRFSKKEGIAAGMISLIAAIVFALIIVYLIHTPIVTPAYSGAV